MIPEGLDHITAQGLTDLLAERFPDVRVRDFERCGDIHGTATKALLKVAYDSPAKGPERMWIKGGWEATSEILRGTGIFSREPRVYAELLPEQA
ncbi:MAG: hypothetical protein JO303_15460, partial [Caulobacteraceae bacterium]|nr:hypothetical protein [Caulobacteraceae bacterium]